jgi:FAD:protein FMN transferase
VTTLRAGVTALSAGVTAPHAPLEADQVHRFRCMAVDVTIHLVRPVGDPQDAVERAEQVFREVESACTRFDSGSPLMQANAAGDRWHQVPRACYRALAEAEGAHLRTRGRFDPRVLGELVALGYDRSLPFGAGPLDLGARGDVPSAGRTLRFRPPWRPGFDPVRSAVRIGPVPVDLGGIGKGLAVRWASDSLQGCADAFLVEAGGDLVTAGPGPGGDGWRAAVEHPRGGQAPVAVLDVTDLACATSSIRLRTWRVNGRPVHHLLDPLTGEPGGEGLLSVTVAGPDPAECEVWSKTLFLSGPAGIERAAAAHRLAALWVDTDGRIASSPAMAAALLWQVSDGR